MTSPIPSKPSASAAEPSASKSPPAASSSQPSVLRSLVSLAIVIHFICVGVVLASNLRRSPLQARLVEIFGAYTQLLNFDPDFTPYYYTFGRPMDDDAIVEIDLYPSGDEPLAGQEKIATVRLPDTGSRWMGDRQRYLAISRVLAFHAMPEIEQTDITSEIVKGIGVRIMRENGAKRAVVRCIQRMSQPMLLEDLETGFPADNPEAPNYDRTVYEADVWILEDGTAGTVPRAGRGEVAPGRTLPPSSSNRGAATSRPAAEKPAAEQPAAAQPSSGTTNPTNPSSGSN